MMGPPVWMSEMDKQEFNLAFVGVDFQKAQSGVKEME